MDWSPDLQIPGHWLMDLPEHQGRIDNKVDWERTLGIWLPFFCLRGSYNSCFFFFLLEGGLVKGCLAESWAWKHLVHVNTTAEDVLNQTGWPALWIAVSGSPSSDSLVIVLRPQNRTHGDRGGDGCLELSSTNLPSPWPLWPLRIQSAQFATSRKGSWVPQMATHLWDQPASSCQVFTVDPFVMGRDHWFVLTGTFPALWFAFSTCAAISETYWQASVELLQFSLIFTGELKKWLMPVVWLL